MKELFKFFIGQHLSDEAVQQTKMFKENKEWVQQAKESGSTIIDIGGDVKATPKTGRFKTKVLN